jgi:hypothetical protein
VSVYCYDLVPKKSKWTKARDDHLRAFYNDQMKVCPAILAYKLGMKEREVLNRLSFLKLRNRREHARPALQR